MELTGREQLTLLAECGGLGAALALLFAIHNGILRTVPYKRRLRFAADVWFGLPTALITFYVSLAVMDGRMHPLLFGGSGMGFALTYGVIGHPLSKGVSRVAGWIRRRSARVMDGTERGMVALYSRISAVTAREFGKIGKRKRSKAEKDEKS